VLAFDVTDSHAISAAADEVISAGPLYGIVNNAGAALPGPLEYLPIEQFERQIDINLTGQLRVAQAMLPALHGGVRAWGDARIVLMGSLDGRLVGPLFGPYAASKHGLVGLADGLCAELYPARIKVVLLEPGAVATPIWQRGTGVLGELQPRLPDGGGPYRSVMEFAQRYVSTLSHRGGSPDRVARAVMEALEASRPRPRRVVGVDAAITAVLVQVLPPRLIYRLTALPAVAAGDRGDAAEPGGDGGAADADDDDAAGGDLSGVSRPRGSVCLVRQMEASTRRVRAPAHLLAPVAVAVRELDLGEDDVHEGVKQLVLAGDVVVGRPTWAGRRAPSPASGWSGGGGLLDRRWPSPR
jgi:NAD(P)-dependent dehydrogenase (short-subunit alcohol dehydrogenase family)